MIKLKKISEEKVLIDPYVRYDLSYIFDYALDIYLYKKEFLIPNMNMFGITTADKYYAIHVTKKHYKRLQKSIKPIIYDPYQRYFGYRKDEFGLKFMGAENSKEERNIRRELKLSTDFFYQIDDETYRVNMGDFLSAAHNAEGRERDFVESNYSGYNEYIKDKGKDFDSEEFLAVVACKKKY